MDHRFGLLRRPASLVIPRSRASVGCLPHRRDDDRCDQPIVVIGDRLPSRSSGGFGEMLGSSRCSPSAGLAFCRYMSAAVGEGAGKIDFVSDVADALADLTAQSVASLAAAPAVNEVAVAAADSLTMCMGISILSDLANILC
ncbi:hypothetical protein MLD38_020997 [Melastoma candidum]|uniref:Uncharacterized protein n=1 Tax=Melastoma candidum TaxID=119954 RepID=A0ACB9QEW0_9MYRT|nr:hypothetical protein MLD38_020997 [Melastoma candidum]